MQLDSGVTTAQVAAAAGSLAVAYIALTVLILPLLSEPQKYWRSQSWVGVKKQAFARIRAGFNSLKHTKEYVAEGYAKVRDEAPRWHVLLLTHVPVLAEQPDVRAATACPRASGYDPCQQAARTGQPHR